jgi:hypothetical protein
MVGVDGQLITPFLIEDWFQNSANFGHEIRIVWFLVVFDVSVHCFRIGRTKQSGRYFWILARKLQRELADRSALASAKIGSGAEVALLFGAGGMPYGRAAISQQARREWRTIHNANSFLPSYGQQF